MCVYSSHYRGTPARPGLVLGLRPGGRCVGRAIGVSAEREAEVMAYLDERELLDVYVYERVRLPVTSVGRGSEVDGWCYVARPDHPQYAGGLDRAGTCCAASCRVTASPAPAPTMCATPWRTCARCGSSEPELERLLALSCEPPVSPLAQAPAGSGTPLASPHAANVRRRGCSRSGSPGTVVAAPLPRRRPHSWMAHRAGTRLGR